MPSPTVCTKCGAHPRVPKQRWCRPCLTAYKLARYWRLRAAATQTDAATAQVVTPAPLVAERPLCLCYRCGYGRWHERTIGDWVCALCGVPPAT
jgi:hypothetical protein